MIRLALPAGDLRSPIATILASAGLAVEGYGEGSRSYRLGSGTGRTCVPVCFRERDIPIQVALGNYDLGICSLAWVKEMAARFPEAADSADCRPRHRIGRSLRRCAAKDLSANFADVATLPVVRIASEYPNIAEAFALAARLPVVPCAGRLGVCRSVSA